MNGYAGRITAKIIYNKVDISNDISAYLKEINYTDVLSGSADDLSIKLEDREHLWQGTWFPEKGATLSVTLQSQYWGNEYEAPKSFYLGQFEIDEIECSHPPSEVTIKAIAVPDNTTLRGVDRSRSWEKVKLKTIAEDIAKTAKMELFYEAEEDPTLDRVEQTEQSDLSFLQKLCEDNGMALKVTNKTIVIFDEKKYEAEPERFIFLRSGEKFVSREEDAQSAEIPIKEEIITYHFRSSVRDVYRACRVVYQKSKSKEKINYLFEDPQKKTGKVLVISQQVDSIAEAEKLAKKELRNKNKEEVTGSFSLRGDFDLSAGLTVLVQGFGYFDGKCIITKVGHVVGNGYRCTVDVRRCINGY